MCYVNCKLCPRQCGVDRTAGQKGFCGGADKALVAKSMLHKWEEPALAGSGGSGAIFFGGCTLGCSYCQNRAISQTPVGEEMDSAALRQRMEDLISQGAENIDLVTPTHFLPTILPALEKPVPVPVVYNCGGYELPQTIEKLAGKVDIFLPDMKYADNALAKTLSGAADYFQVAAAAIQKMAEIVGRPQWEGDKLKKGVIIRHLILPGQVENSLEIVGRPQWEGDKLKKGVIIRHLILPGQVENSLKVLDWIGQTFPKGQVLVSLMRQYTPMPGLQPPFDRKITDQEYDAVLSWMYLNGLQGFIQEKESADSAFIPEF